MEGVSPDDARPALGDCGRWLASLKRAVFACRGNAAHFLRDCGSIASLIGGSALVVLTGCATYQSVPLPAGPDLVATVRTLDATVPRDASLTAVARIDTTRPLTIDQIGLLAILNDPDLKSEAGAIDATRAGIVQATIIPNPVANISYGALISGPATTSSFSAALSQGIAQLITRQARIKSAKFHAGQVDADQLWREWQVTQKARQLAADIYSGDLSIELTRHQIALLSQELNEVKKAIAAGNLTLAAQAPLATAQAGAENAFVSLKLDRLKSWQALDGLLGLDPMVRFRIARPVIGSLPANIEELLADLPERRPDLVALQLGYSSAEEDVRAAILGQFPALTLGGSYNKDTSDVISVGPTFDLGLPVFDRNQGHIANAGATRLLLRAQYQARLDTAYAHVHALVAQIRQLSADLATARKAGASAQSLAITARQAYAQNNLDQRTVTDYETTALERRLEVIAIERQIVEDKIFIAVELGLGLPKMRLALSGEPPL
jgi:cobalt-zinc-cadmium efflux system outer membrane protein